MLPRRANGYRRIDEKEERQEGDGHGEVANPLQEAAALEMTAVPIASQTKPQALRILYKEQAYDITGLHGEISVAQLKEQIAAATEVPVPRQRLIIAGKMMRPDEATLSSFKLVDNASIHLFPIPLPASAVPVASAVPSSSGAAQPHVPTARQTHALSAYEMDGVVLTPAHYDPVIVQTSRDIKMWCSLLIVLSTVSLFNNISYFTATGAFGTGNLDSFVFLLDTACSAAGLVVGSMGLKSVRTLDMADVRKYLRYLFVLALACIVLRICWVFDVSAAVRRAYRAQQKEDAEDPDPDDPDGHDTQRMDKHAIVAFTMEAAVVAAVCIGAWASCVGRAVTLHAAVSAHRPPTAAAATATVAGGGGPAAALAQAEIV